MLFFGIIDPTDRPVDTLPLYRTYCSLSNSSQTMSGYYVERELLPCTCECEYRAHGSRPFNLTGQHGPFLKSTGEILLNDQRQGSKHDSDMRVIHFLKSTCDMEENKRQRHVTLPFLKIDMRHGDPPPRQGPQPGGVGGPLWWFGPCTCMTKVGVTFVII